MLTRAESPSWNYDPLEAAANAFATGFLLPKWLLISQAARHHWTRRSLTTPGIAYHELKNAGFLLFRDDRLIPNADDDVGGEVERVLVRRTSRR